MTEMQAPTFAAGFDPNRPADGVAPGQEFGDYFGFGNSEKFMFPDGVSFIEFRAMNEGEKKSYQDKTSQDVIMEKNSGDARMKFKAGHERHELIRTCAISWNLRRGGQPLETDLKSTKGRAALSDFLNYADPRIVENLEKAIRKANPWLLAEMKPEDIRKQIDDLEEMYTVAVKRESGEGN